MLQCNRSSLEKVCLQALLPNEALVILGTTKVTNTTNSKCVPLDFSEESVRKLLKLVLLLPAKYVKQYSPYGKERNVELFLQWSVDLSSLRHRGLLLVHRDHFHRLHVRVLLAARRSEERQACEAVGRRQGVTEGLPCQRVEVVEGSQGLQKAQGLVHTCQRCRSDYCTTAYLYLTSVVVRTSISLS